MQHLLDMCRVNFGAPGRWFSSQDRTTYLDIPKPIWWEESDSLDLFFRGFDNLLRDGVIVWGHVIQANYQLWEAGDENHPGEVVCSVGEHADMSPEELAEVAHRLGQLKGTEPTNRRERAIAYHLTNEYTRVFGLPVPGHLSSDHRCEISTVLFARHHLPNGMLARPLFPALVSPRHPRLATVVPSRYWPEELVAWWLEAGD